jgi:peptidyl-prolyl cis-trans isomerase D
MLRGIRKASSNWVGKTIMAAVVLFLVASFAIWGIGDIFRGFGLSTVAKIGSTEITIDQFRVIYNERLQQLSRQVGRPLTPDQASALGLDRQIIGQLMAETALDERARQLGLGL